MFSALTYLRIFIEKFMKTKVLCLNDFFCNLKLFCYSDFLLLYIHEDLLKNLWKQKYCIENNLKFFDHIRNNFLSYPKTNVKNILMHMK